MSALVVRRLEPHEFEEFSPRIAALEKGITYPLGADRFEIDHGRDYFAFFARLGVADEAEGRASLRYYVALEGPALRGVLAAVLRRIPLTGDRSALAWYVCDLKANHASDVASRRGIGLPLARAFQEDAAAVAPAAFAISMNGSDGRNRLVPFLSRLVSPPPRVATRLLLYSLDANCIRARRTLLEEHLGAISFLDLRGKKDIVLSSTSRSLPLLHLQHGELADHRLATAEPRDGYVHMFCVPEGRELVAALERSEIAPSASATVLTFGGAIASTFDFVLTSDI